jgi:hypothetical protein
MSSSSEEASVAAVPTPVEDREVLVEFVQRPGVQQVALTPSEVAEKSAEALDSAMNTIRQMAGKVCATVAAMTERPAGVQVAFGLKFDAEAGAFIAKTGLEASVNVTLTWSTEPHL